jgi:NitT/TauT family transport system permease protein
MTACIIKKGHLVKGKILGEKQVQIQLKRVGILAFWLVLWQMGAMVVQMPLILPTPWESLVQLVGLLGTAAFYTDVGYTFYRCVVGIVYSFLAGMLTAFLSYRYLFFRNLLSLPVNFLKSTPVMAVIIYALLLLTSSQVPIFVCFMMCFPVVHVNLLSGLDNVSREYLEMAQVYGLTPKDQYRFIYLPSIEPEVKASLNLIAGLSWKSVVAAEVLSVPAYSMGYNLLNAKVYFETPELFAWIMAIVGFSYGFERIIRRLLSRMDHKEYQGSKVLRKDNGVVFEKRIPREEREEPEDLAVQDLTKRYGEKEVFSGFDLVIHGGQITALMGPSGKGKTTLLRILAGLETPDQGQVRGAHSSISYLFQEDRLLPWLNIYDNLALVLKDAMNRQDVDQEICLVLEQMELGEERYKLPSQLSGGMRHRVAMARAFIYPADYLLLDEPFKGLDEALKDRIINCCWSYYTQGRSVLMVTHQPKDAQQLAQRVVII